MKRKLLIAAIISFFIAGLAAYGLCSSETTNLGLSKPSKGDRNWGQTTNDNMDKLDAAYGFMATVPDDLPEVYIYNDTFNSTTGRTITLPKSVDNVNEYAVKITPTTRAGAIDDIYVTKTTTNFVVKCSAANTTDTFCAAVYYIGDVTSYGGSIYRRWYVSPANTITDHANASTTGSIAWVQAQIGSSPATVELPGNKNYQIKNNLTINDKVRMIFQKGAIIDTDFSILDGNYEWYQNGATSEYYLQATGGGNPNINMPSVVIENNAQMTDGAAGSLAAGEWDWNDVNGLGYTTVYVRLSDSTDPDTKSADYVEAGYKITFNDKQDFGTEQIFSGQGKWSFPKGVIKAALPQWWGAVEGTGNDCAFAINAAIDAGPDTGYPIKITHGVWEFQSQLDFGIKMHSLIGDGWGSVLYANVGSGVNAINIGNSASSTFGFSMRNIAVLGASSSCQYTVKATRTHEMKFENVMLLAGAAQYALWMEGCIYNDMEINIHTPPDNANQPTWARPANGIKVTTLSSPTTMQSNVNKFMVNISNLTGNGFYLDGSSGQINSTSLRGSIEYITGTYVIYAYDAEHLDIHDLYGTDGNTGLNYFENCTHTNFGPGYKTYTSSAGNNISLVNCTWTTIDQAGINTLTIDSDTFHTVIGAVTLYDAPGIVDGGVNTIYQGPITCNNVVNKPLHNTHMAQDHHNYFANSNFERWQSDRPDTWSKPGTVTWTQESTTVHNTTNSAKAVQSTSFTAVEWTDPDEVNFRAKAKGKYISFCVWIYQDESGGGTPGASPYIRLRVVSSGSGNLDNYSYVTIDYSTYDAWVRHYISAYVPTDTTDIQIMVWFDKTIYLAEPSLMIGSHNQYGWVQEWNEHNEYMVIAGSKITFGSAAPAAGYWKQGDVCYNTGASAGGSPGWVCVTSGSPGTWRAMANVAS